MIFTFQSNLGTVTAEQLTNGGVDIITLIDANGKSITWRQLPHHTLSTLEAQAQEAFRKIEEGLPVETIQQAGQVGLVAPAAPVEPAGLVAPVGKVDFSIIASELLLALDHSLGNEYLTIREIDEYQALIKKAREVLK
jgi:hypothetical protein